MSDWIRLLVKFKGKCAECSKEIQVGEYALWSKSSKAIKHEKCEVKKMEKKEEDKLQEGKKGEKSQEAPELDCFICARPAGCVECGFESDCDRWVISQACICSQCLENKHAYTNYQQAFVEKARKAKVKL